MSVIEYRGLWSDGLWHAYLYPGRADLLLAAVDPDVPHVVVEGHGLGHDWRTLPVSLAGEPPRDRRVRFLSYDLALTPAQCRLEAEALRAAAAGSLWAWQGVRLPPPGWRLSDKKHEQRAAAMRGLGISMFIYLPHDGETCQVVATDEDVLQGFLSRLNLP